MGKYAPYSTTAHSRSKPELIAISYSPNLLFAAAGGPVQPSSLLGSSTICRLEEIREKKMKESSHGG